MPAQLLQEDCLREGLVIFVHIKPNFIEIIDLNLAHASLGGSVFKSAKSPKVLLAKVCR